MGILKDRILIILILEGLFFRLILIQIPGFHFDVITWFAWADRLNQLGFANFYSDQIWTNYTPGYLYILYILGWIKHLLNLSDTLFYLILKLPSIVSEIILAIFIYQIISKKSVLWGRVAAILVLFNPAFIFNSSIWGQIDGLLSLFMLLSIYFLNQKRLIASSVFLGLSLLIKPQAIAIFPIFVFFIFHNLAFKNLVKLVLPFIFVVFLLSLPFFISQPILGFYQLFSKMISDYSHTSLFAYNFWGIVGFWISDSLTWGNLSYQNIGFILFAIYWIIICYLYLKKKLSLYTLAALSLLGFYFLPTRVHERYLYPAIVFLSLTASIFKSRLLIFLTMVLSFFHLMNLYYVYVYYNEFYLKLPKLLYNPILYNFLDGNAKLLSLTSTIIFILIILVIIKSHAFSKKV